MLLFFSIILFVASAGRIGLNLFGDMGSPTGESRGFYTPGFVGIGAAGILFLFWLLT